MARTPEHKKVDLTYSLSTSVTVAVKRATAIIDAIGGLEPATEMADVARLVALASLGIVYAFIFGQKGLIGELGLQGPPAFFQAACPGDAAKASSAMGPFGAIKVSTAFRV